jgi:hypothetical protein
LAGKARPIPTQGIEKRTARGGRNPETRV